MAIQEKPYIVFGYGSLIFKPPPHVIKEVHGYLKGYVRRFAQKSHDHRGTPEKPGRVVTLVHKEDWDGFSGSDPFPNEDVVWGVAYTIDPLYESEVRDYLGMLHELRDYSGILKFRADYREKDGYTIEEIDVWGVVDGHEVVVAPKAFTYVGLPSNPSFIGSEPIDQLAEHIWKSVGPSGRNKDYLYELTAAVRRLAPESHDSHLYALETKCRQLDAERGEQ